MFCVLKRRHMAGVMVAASSAAIVAACSSNNTAAPSSARINRPAFTESEYGVNSSPRLAGQSTRIAKGGGHYKLGAPYKVAGRWYVPRENPNHNETGIASWYGADFHGRKTSNGEIFDMRALTAAHPTLPLPSYAYVTNLDNGRTVLVRVNDRGPYVGGRVIDMSYASATALGYVGQGRARVRVRYAGRAPLNGDDRHEQAFLRRQPWARGTDVRMASASRVPPVPVETMRPQPVASVQGWSPTTYRAALAGKPTPSYLGVGVNLPVARTD